MSNSHSLRRIAAATALLFAVAAPSLAEEEAPGVSIVDRAFDAAVLRPLGAAAVLAGAVLLVPAALVTAPGGMESVDNAYDVFLRMPLENLIDTPLGEGYGG